VGRLCYFSLVFATELKARLRRGDLTLGPMMSFDFWPGYLEIFKAEGMDFVFLDLEHSAASLRDVEEICRVGRLIGLPVLLRPEASVYHLIRKYVDMGPAGLILPWTEQAAQLDAVQDGLFLPPKGKRGPGGPAIFANRGLDRAAWDEVEESLCVVMQIESPRGLANLAELGARDWVDAVMVGPYDLSLNLGRHGQMDHPEVIEAIDGIHRGAQALGKPCGMVIGMPEQAAFWRARGFHFLVTGEVSGMVRQRTRQFVETVRAR
jgi:4-hydroxy-2-oxoheptanedioate aldolase